MAFVSEAPEPEPQRGEGAVLARLTTVRTLWSLWYVTVGPRPSNLNEGNKLGHPHLNLNEYSTVDPFPNERCNYNGAQPINTNDVWLDDVIILDVLMKKKIKINKLLNRLPVNELKFVPLWH